MVQAQFGTGLGCVRSLLPVAHLVRVRVRLWLRLRLRLRLRDRGRSGSG